MNKEIAAANAVKGGVDKNTPIGDVVPFEQNGTGGNGEGEVVAVDLVKHPFTKEAAELWYTDINSYTDARGRHQRETRRHFVPLPAAQDIAKALGRQITLEELNLLVGLDGDPAECSITKRKFQPVWWVLITTRLLDTVASAKELSDEVLHSCRAIVVGQYFPHPDRDKAENFIVSGVPYYWRKDMDNDFAYWSDLWKIHQINEMRWGDEYAVSKRILAQRQAQNEEEKARKEGLGRMAEAFAQNRTGRGRDRR